ncbi:hypothetical protein K7432_001690 [Basidiobolus ranarum]|uniref:Chromo domain-containing protein n=1 Tax=Basidiobolus ranarum TaxID=34480 RepID=A0ABR2X2L9_9FUNG
MSDWLEELSSEDSLHDFIVRDEDMNEETERKPRNTFEVEIITPRLTRNGKVKQENEREAKEKDEVVEEEESDEEEDDDEEVSEWEVEDIMKQKIVKGEEWYLIKWRGYDELTWEPLDHLNCPDLLLDFLDRSNLKSVQFESLKKSSSFHPQATPRSKSRRIMDQGAGGFSSVAKFKKTLETTKSDKAKGVDPLPGYKRKHGYDASIQRSETEKEWENQLRTRENLIQSLNSQYASLPRFKKTRTNLPSTSRSYEKESVLPSIIPNHSVSSQTKEVEATSKKPEIRASPPKEVVRKTTIATPMESSRVSSTTESLPIRKPPVAPERHQTNGATHATRGDSARESNYSPKMNPMREPDRSPKANRIQEPSHPPKLNATQAPNRSPKINQNHEPNRPPNANRTRESNHSPTRNRARELVSNPVSHDNRSTIISKNIADPRKAPTLISPTVNRTDSEAGTPVPTPQSTAEAMFGSVPLFSRNPILSSNPIVNSDTESSGTLDYTDPKERPPRSFAQKPTYLPKPNSEHPTYNIRATDWICRLYKGKMKEMGLVRIGAIGGQDIKLFDTIKEISKLCFSKMIRFSYIKSLVEQSIGNETLSICYVHPTDRSINEEKYNKFTGFLARGGLVGITAYENVTIVASPVNSDLLTLLRNPSESLGRMCLLLINDHKLAKEGLNYDKLLPETIEFTSKYPVTPSNLLVRTWENILKIKTDHSCSQVSMFGPSRHPEVLGMEAILKHRGISLDPTMNDVNTKALLIHRSSLSQIHMIPHLNDLKQREAFNFIVFGFTVNIPQDQALPNILFPSGGVVAITSELLLTNDRVLHKLMEYKDLKRHTEAWKIVISDSTVSILRKEAANNHAKAIKSCQIVEDLIKSERIKCIVPDVSKEAESTTETDTHTETFGMLLKLQGLLKAECRHFIILTTKEKLAPSHMGIQFLEPSNVDKWFNLEKL